MSHRPSADVGAHIKAVQGNVPIADDGAAAKTGTGFDRTGYLSCTLFCQTGAATGTPTAQTCDAKLQDSADDSTYADVTGAAITQITADNGSAKIDVDLTMVEQYIRVVKTVALTGGSTPTWPSSTVVVLGGADVLPAA